MNELKNTKILYIDDEQEVREAAVEYLGFYSDYVSEAYDGIHGFEMFEKVQPDIIITDINMPRQDGLAMIKKIRLVDSEVKIIVATAFLDSKYLLLAVELGLIKYLVKPITEGMLLPVLLANITKQGERSNIIQLTSLHRYDQLNQTLFKDTVQISLSKKALLCLALLVKNKSTVVSYENLNHVVWEGNMTEEALRSVVKELRAKISKKSIKNLSGVGYQVLLES